MSYSAAEALQKNAALIKKDASDGEVSAAVDNLLRNADSVAYNEVDNTIRIDVTMDQIRSVLAPKRLLYAGITDFTAWAHKKYSPLKWTVMYSMSAQVVYFYAKVVS
jgi:hypothetical protein